MSNDATPAKVRLTDGLGRPPERADFEAWASSAAFGECDEKGRFWFYRNGGDGMWEAYCAGAGDQRGRDAVSARDHLNAIFRDMSPQDEWLVKVRRLVQGFEHVSGLARLWEPDFSSGSERALWARATEACADVAKLLRDAEKA